MGGDPAKEQEGQKNARTKQGPEYRRTEKEECERHKRGEDLPAHAELEPFRADYKATHG